MSLETVSSVSRFVNWGLYFAAMTVIVALTWHLPLPQYVIVIACVAIVQSSAYWRGRHEEEP
jgi:hypothetical protein